MSTSPPPTPSSADSGLRWRIKLSFLQYISRLPDGRCSVTDGAEIIDEQEFLFAADTESAPEANKVKFRGDVRFGGHHRLLFLRIADPWLEVGDDAAATLSIAAEPDRIALATLDLRQTADGYLGTDVRLTEAGSELFNLVYPAGERLDNLTTLPCSTLQEATP
ncbi:HtaA domain-containing protein [Paractinoplanes lichenicola]|uniref:HtaA domain-containing protein n=1 Tax=Paractinoplanes lichenicola TaxID=2802976 RepID=A0ABS1VMM9_9ACTN|nr:HtaA domain-containing protein [Actinoplanes lichenicola]MBL7255984.1 HtaA domain-containing protein [Actinoplanes lichenicola]